MQAETQPCENSNGRFNCYRRADDSPEGEGESDCFEQIYVLVWSRQSNTWRSTGKKSLPNTIKGLKASRMLDDLQRWEGFRVNYFYPDTPLQESTS
jgi:hypothetical protein